MKSMMHAVILTATCAVTLAAQQPAPPAPQARQPGPPAGGPPGEMRSRMGPPGFGPRGFPMMEYSPTALLERREALNLTPDQVTKLSTLETEAKAAREKAQNDAKPHREELQKLWEQTAPDVTQLRTHAQALMQAEQAAQLTGITTSAQAKAVLTPEQRGRVQGWADARGGLRGERMRGGPGMMFRRRGPGPDGMMRQMPRFRRSAGEL